MDSWPKGVGWSGELLGMLMSVSMSIKKGLDIWLCSGCSHSNK